MHLLSDADQQCLHQSWYTAVLLDSANAHCPTANACTEEVQRNLIITASESNRVSVIEEGLKYKQNKAWFILPANVNVKQIFMLHIHNKHSSRVELCSIFAKHSQQTKALMSNSLCIKHLQEVPTRINSKSKKLKCKNFFFNSSFLSHIFQGHIHKHNNYLGLFWWSVNWKLNTKIELTLAKIQ